MRIDRKMNIVVPLKRDDGDLYVHATPIDDETFDRYFIPISKTFAELMKLGLSFISGPSVAMNMLRKVSMDLGVWDGPEGVEAGLLTEIKRLSNVIVPTEGGWRPIPLQVALERGMLTKADIREADGQVTFFIVTSATCTRDQLPSLLGGLTRLWDAQVTSLNSTEYASSLRTSIETESSGGKATT